MRDEGKPTEENMDNTVPVGSGDLLGFYQVGELVAVYGRLVGLDFVKPEENAMRITYHPRAGIPSVGEEVVVCRRDYFETLCKKTKAGSKQ